MYPWTLFFREQPGVGQSFTSEQVSSRCSLESGVEKGLYTHVKLIPLGSPALNKVLYECIYDVLFKIQTLHVTYYQVSNDMSTIT